MGSPADVTIVASNSETLGELRAYFRRAGIAARGVRSLDAFLRDDRARRHPCILFPDDFPRDVVMATLADFTDGAPGALAILVTAHRHRFAQLPANGSVLVVPRPVWAWTLVDVLRAHAPQPSSKRERARES
jgi:hypothetical protein